MTELLMLLLLLGVACMVGLVQAVVHGHIIRLWGVVHRKVKHRWMVARAMVCVLAAWLLPLAGPWWLAALACMPLTSSVFRYALALDLKERRWHPLYLGLGAYYDRFLLWWWIQPVPPDTTEGHVQHSRRYHNDASYRESVHDAGRTGYTLELFATALLGAIYLIH